MLLNLDQEAVIPPEILAACLNELMTKGTLHNPWTGEDLTEYAMDELRKEREEQIALELEAVRGQGRMTSARTATGLRVAADLPVAVEMQFERDLGKGALRDPKVRKELAKFHPEWFPKEAAGGTGRTHALGGIPA